MNSFRERALALFPGGSNGEYGFPAERAVVLESGRGSRVWDTNGREYLDMTMAWGAALVGHAHPKVVEATTCQAQRGINFASVNAKAVELAERIASVSPCVERIRFVASGTEATMLCLRVAQVATGRPKVLKFEGAYHGQHPIGITSLLGGQLREFPAADVSGAGAPWVEHGVLVAPFNNLRATEDIIVAHARELAAVIVEPIHRCLTPVPGFLDGLRALTREQGLVLIFDVVRRFAQPLGIRLPDWEGRIIETEKGIVRLLPVAERARQLFGEEGASAMAATIERSGAATAQFSLFPESEAGGGVRSRRGRADRSRPGGPSPSEGRRKTEATTLDRVHVAMLLQANGASNALRSMIEEEQKRGPDFLRLANALSALYPKTNEEKRLLDAMLLAAPRR